jgi:hypothetical protein
VPRESTGSMAASSAQLALQWNDHASMGLYAVAGSPSPPHLNVGFALCE